MSFIERLIVRFYAYQTTFTFPIYFTFTLRSTRYVVSKIIKFDILSKAYSRYCQGCSEVIQTGPASQ